jgi:hypothetical protein
MPTEPTPTLAVGTPVDVFSTYRQNWVRGFEIAAVQGEAYAVRRVLDAAVLPVAFESSDLRVAAHGW